MDQEPKAKTSFFL